MTSSLRIPSLKRSSPTNCTKPASSATPNLDGVSGWADARPRRDTGVCDAIAGPWRKGGPRTGPEQQPGAELPVPRLAAGRASPERSRPLSVGEAMDKETKREILLLALGTALLEAPFVAIAVAIMSH